MIVYLKLKIENSILDFEFLRKKSKQTKNVYLAKTNKWKTKKNNECWFEKI